MTGRLLLDWAALAISFFNTILLLWLGLTVLLNAERRAWGIWVAVGGLLAGSALLVIHSALYAQGWARISLGLSLGWLAGWALIVALPLTWYLVMLWYAGYWERVQSPLRARHRPWLAATGLLAAGLLALLVLANPFPTYRQIVGYETTAAMALRSTSIVGPAGLAYPLHIVLCTALSVDVLLRPAPSGRVMGDLARRRTRPWLLATSLALLAISGLVAWVVSWVVVSSQRAASDPYGQMAVTVARLDLLISSVLAVAILLLGQAVVSYEIFTGKTLPRRGLRRHWRGVVVLAAGFGLLAAGSLTHGIRPVNGLLLAGGLVTLFVALLARQSFAERERYIDHLRPFVGGVRLYSHLLGGPSPDPPAIDVATPFQALCGEVLGARAGYLLALGPLVPLVGPPLAYPSHAEAPAAAVASIAAQFGSSDRLCLPIDPAAYAGATWAVALRFEGRLIGLLLLGEKRDGGLYTQEEMEMARSSGERLIDTAASAEMARRLMALQRQRLAESQVLDQRARRVLHDDVLPQLHAAILGLASRPAPGDDAAGGPAALLAGVHRQVSNLLHELPAGPTPELPRLGLAGALRQVAERELEGAFERVTWQVEPEAAARARELPPRWAEVIYYAAREAMRNAARHARGHDPAQPLQLRVALAWRDGLELTVEDNGVGVAHAGPAESGSGLALHSTMMAVIGGSLTLESVPGACTRVTLLLPLAG